MLELYMHVLDRALTPILLLLALILLLAGHNTPGGGFIAGLVVATAFQLQILSRGDEFVRKAVGKYLQPLMGIGLLLAVIAALIGVAQGGFFKGIWWSLQLGNMTIELGTPVIFDIGVFCVVLSFVTSYLLELSRHEERDTP